ncbi:MAG: glyoxalase [Ignavibacteriales bacterium]|nr:glyoxalase [Ignavibacteriales bacterium]
MGAAVTHFEINARDGKKMQEFYSALFGWKIDANNPINYGLVNTGLKMGIQGGIGQIEAGKQPFVIFYVQVEKPQEYLDKAVSMGATVVLPITVVPNMVTYGIFSDPEGNMVGIVEGPQKDLKPAKAKKPSARKKRTSGRRGKKSRRR